MSPRHLAALVAVVFAVSVASPDLGLVVHRHAGGDEHHEHDDEEAHHRRAAHDHGHDHHDVADHDHHHDRVPDHHEAVHRDDEGPAPGTALTRAGHGWAWHTHWTQPVHRAARTARAALAPPQPVARLTPDVPRERIAAATPAGRSRAPPRIEPA